jgi:hypothetical protein
MCRAAPTHRGSISSSALAKPAGNARSDSCSHARAGLGVGGIARYNAAGRRSDVDEGEHRLALDALGHAEADSHRRRRPRDKALGSDISRCSGLTSPTVARQTAGTPLRAGVVAPLTFRA